MRRSGCWSLGREEAVVAADPAEATWLQIRFGGRLGSVCLERADLQRQAATLPAADEYQVCSVSG
jgi:hypothetical protein